MNKILMTVLLSVATLQSFCFADGVGSRGGGNVQESDLRYLIGKLDIYLQSAEGKQAFPEIGEFDSIHGTENSFHNLMSRVYPVVVDGQVQDSFQDARDCVAEIGNFSNPSFTCNGKALPEMKLENEPSLYRIVLHELFVIAGIEKPISKAVPSDYKVSSRLEVHLETSPEWVPGSAPKPVTPVVIYDCKIPKNSMFGYPSVTDVTYIKEFEDGSGSFLIRNEAAMEMYLQSIDGPQPGPSSNITTLQGLEQVFGYDDILSFTDIQNPASVSSVGYYTTTLGVVFIVFKDKTGGSLQGLLIYGPKAYQCNF